MLTMLTVPYVTVSTGPALAALQLVPVLPRVRPGGERISWWRVQPRSQASSRSTHTLPPSSQFAQGGGRIPHALWYNAP